MVTNAEIMRAQKKRRRKDTLSAYLFLSPALLIYICFFVIPIIMVGYLTFHKYNVITPAVWNDYKNFIRLTMDKRVPLTIWNSFKMVLLICPMHIIVSLLLALGVNSIRNRTAVFAMRTILYFPVLVSVTAVALAWKFIFSTDFGVINWFLSLLRCDPIPWLQSSFWAYPAFMIFSLWKNVGLYFLYFYIALRGIDRSILEAAELDGAKPARKFFSITLPMISPTTFFVVVTMLIGCMQIFDEPYILTNGGPGDATRSFYMYIYETAFVSQNYGYACVLALIMMAIVLTITLIQFKGNSWVSYERD